MLTIGKLGEAAGVKVPTIRYYEQIGLLPEPERSEEEVAAIIADVLRAIVEDAGGSITLVNRDGGGLVAAITLPRS